MNIGEIAERLIRAAEVDRASHEHVGPQPPRSLQLPYVFDWVDKLGWHKEAGDMLTEDPLAEERRRFWERMGLTASAQELSVLESIREWLLSVSSDGERRALLAWARSKVGGKSFKSWCFKIEGIHPETGRRRKDRALHRISAYLVRSAAQHHETGSSPLLRRGADFDHIPATIAEDAGRQNQQNHWRADGALVPFLTDGKDDFSWADKRNELRRQRAARKKKQAA